MSKSPYVFPAQPNTTAIQVNIPDTGLPENTSPDDFISKYCTQHAVVGWEVCGTWAVPLCAYPINPQLTVATMLTNGEVADVELQETFRDRDAWAYAAMDSYPVKSDKRAGRPSVPAEAAEAPGITSREIDDIGLTGRAVAPLKREDIGTVSDFGNYASDEISGIKGISAQAMKDIRVAMEVEGVAFNDETPSSKPVPVPPADPDFSDIL